MPVVVTNVGDVPRVAGNGIGVLVPSKNPDALADALNALLDDPAKMRALSASAQAHVSRNWSASRKSLR